MNNEISMVLKRNSVNLKHSLDSENRMTTKIIALSKDKKPKNEIVNKKTSPLK
jgi:hypothetical protein